MALMARTAIVVSVSLVVFTAAASCSVSDTLPGGGGSGNTGPDPTVVCEEQCLPLHPAGEVDYRALRACLLCSACADACKSAAAAVCGDTALESASACSEIAGQDCAACAAGACALSQLPDLTFTGVCAPQAQLCAMNVGCVQLNGCVADCVTMPPGTGGMMAAGGMGGN